MDSGGGCPREEGSWYRTAERPLQSSTITASGFTVLITRSTSLAESSETCEVPTMKTSSGSLHAPCPSGDCQHQWMASSATICRYSIRPLELLSSSMCVHTGIRLPAVLRSSLVAGTGLEYHLPPACSEGSLHRSVQRLPRGYEAYKPAGGCRR